MSKQSLLNLPWVRELLKTSRITVVDGGARGDVFPPFDQLDSDIVSFIKFEPDVDAPVTKEEHDIVINKALWNVPSDITLHIANEPSVSSIYPPDLDLIERVFIEERLVNYRRTQKKVTVSADSIDSLFEKKEIPSIDFIKLDVHGCEYEVIQGASDMLTNSSFGVLAETWSLPIHNGQKLHADFESLMNQHQFFLFERLNKGFSRRSQTTSPFHKHQPFLYDCLFFKDPNGESLSSFDRVKAIKYVGITELFGHYGYAAQLNEFFYEKKLFTAEEFSQIKSLLQSKNDFFAKYVQKAAERLNRYICKFY